MASTYDRGIRRRQRSSDEVIRTLEDYVRFLRARYERTSDSMQAAVACGSIVETSLWLTRY